MDNVLIYYNNDSLLYIIEDLKKLYGLRCFEILRCGERASQEMYDSIPILSDYRNVAKNKYSYAFVISEAPFVNKMVYELHLLGVKTVYILNAEYLPVLNNDETINKIITKFDLSSKPLVGYVETHVYNQCNLNCKGCTHFSNIDNSKAISLMDFEKNMFLLSKFYNVNTLRLMGGEPLLNRDLDKYILIARKYFPFSNIDIATNGLLITRLPEETIKVITENNIALKVSLYLPVDKIKDKLEAFFSKHGIRHIYGNGCKQVDDNVLIRRFHKCLTLEKQFNAKYNCENCFARECWFLKNGLIAKCVTPLQIEILNRKFGTCFEVTDKDFINLETMSESSWNDINKLLSENDFCKYCTPVKEEYEWEIKSSNQELEDYIVGGRKYEKDKRNRTGL